jgi:hypothetical protein
MQDEGNNVYIAYGTDRKELFEKLKRFGKKKGETLR